MIALLDYGVGNIKSLKNAFTHIGQETLLTSDPELIKSSSALVIPGVGAFRHGMDSLMNLNLLPVINDFASSGKPILGICLGFQLLTKESEEFGHTEGLGYFSAVVKKLQPVKRLPHIGWQEVTIPKANHDLKNLFEGIQDYSFYFVHSYGVFPSSDDLSFGKTTYENVSFASVSIKNNVIGVQFHPEKSGESGLIFLKNFIKWIQR